MNDGAGPRPRADDHAAAEAALRQGWDPPRPWALVRLDAGSNNLVWRVATPAGSYVLRLHSNQADLAHLRFEHAVLAGVQAQGMPFAVPLPLPTRDGVSVTMVEVDGHTAPATLTPLIPGAHPVRTDLDQARAAGEAIARLDDALARVVPPDSDAGVSWRTSGDIARCHPLVPDPPAAFHALPVPAEMRTRLLSGYAALTAEIGRTYPMLPTQLQHEDTDSSNILLQGTHVTGILDFEFCARDVRPMDLTIALFWWPVAQFGTGAEWPLIRALAVGYALRRSLAHAEVAALPLLFRYRAYTSLVHRYGRYVQGLSPLAQVVARAEAAVAREDWLRASGARLVDEVGQAFGW